jgi:chromosome segregation ATPase
MSIRAASFQHNVLNDVLGQSTDVNVALNRQVAHATSVASALEKRLFALQAELQQCRDCSRGATTVLEDIKRSAGQTGSPRNLHGSAAARHSTPSRQTAAAHDAAAGLEAAIDAVGSSLTMLQALVTEMGSTESRLSVQIRWLRDLISRDSDCITSVTCRPQRAREYRHSGGLAVGADMSTTEWPTQANDTYLAAAEVMQRSSVSRRSAFEVCKHAQLMLARSRKAASDEIAESVKQRLEHRHALKCEIESLGKRAHDTSKVLVGTKDQLKTLKEPLRATLSRQSARRGTEDDVGRALSLEKEAVVRGYKHLRHVTKQLECDLAGFEQAQESRRNELECLERDLNEDKRAMMSESALRVTLAPQAPQRLSVRTYHTGDHVGFSGAGPNPISWDPMHSSPRELPFSLWNNLCARQYPGQRRDGKSASPKGKRSQTQDGATPPGGPKSVRTQHVPKPPPKTARK